MNNLGNKEIMAKNIRYYMEKEKLNAKDFAQKLDFKYSTVLDWINAKTYPRIDKIEVMANYFKINKSDLVELNKINLNNEETTTFEYKVSKTVKELQNKRQKKVLIYAQNELKEQNEELKKQAKKEIKLYPVQTISSAAAGVGFSYDNNDIETYYTDEQPPNHDYATVVSGDSMEPKYTDGEIVYIKAGYSGANGEIYVIDYDGKSYIKKLYHDGDRLRLISLNDKYEPIYIPLPTNKYLNIVGKIIGKFKPKNDE